MLQSNRQRRQLACAPFQQYPFPTYRIQRPTSHKPTHRHTNTTMTKNYSYNSFSSSPTTSSAIVLPPPLAVILGLVRSLTHLFRSRCASPKPPTQSAAVGQNTRLSPTPSLTILRKSSISSESPAASSPPLSPLSPVSPKPWRRLWQLDLASGSVAETKLAPARYSLMVAKYYEVVNLYANVILQRSRTASDMVGS